MDISLRFLIIASVLLLVCAIFIGIHEDYEHFAYHVTGISIGMLYEMEKHFSCIAGDTALSHHAALPRCFSIQKLHSR